MAQFLSAIKMARAEMPQAKMIFDSDKDSIHRSFSDKHSIRKKHLDTLSLQILTQLCAAICA